jgi:hypothetical protein
MGHDTGLEKSYYKPSEKDILEEFKSSQHLDHQ